MQDYVAKNGFGDTKALLDYAYALSTHYGEAIGALSCQMYEATAAAQGVTVKAAEAAATPEYGEVAKAVNGAKKQSDKLVPSTVGRLVKQVGADTTLKNAMRDGAQFAWVPQGDTCAFCLVLASRGWQYMSKKALKGGHAEHIHANCDCQYAVRFDGFSTVQGYDPDEYLEMYNNAEGNSSQEKINSMRRNQANFAKAINSMKVIDGNNSKGRAYTRESFLKEMQKSPVGTEMIKAIRDSNVQIEIHNEQISFSYRGEQWGSVIKLYSQNINEGKQQAQTLIHEMTHYKYNIGNCQHAEAICFSYEKMHIEGRNFLYVDEWEKMKKLAIDNYPELQWEKGGYGDYEQFDFIRKR